MAEKFVVRVVMDVTAPAAAIEVKDGDGTKIAVPLPVDEKLAKRMDGRQRQFFYATRKDDGTIKLGAFAPYQEW